MVLVVDVGNTNITFGIFDKEQLRVKFSIETKVVRTSDEYCQMFLNCIGATDIKIAEIDDAIVASVVPDIMESLLSGIRNVLNREPLIINSDSDTGMMIQTETPAQLGADRLVDAVAAYHIYGGPLLVIDFGTATTYDYVTENGEFLGGAIAPGIKLCAEALTEKAAMLPKIEIIPPASVLGRNTVRSMQVGVVYGYIGQVEYIVGKMKEELSCDMKVVATGGLSFVFKGHTNAIDIYDDDLTLKGLKYLYERQINQPRAH